MSTDRSVSPVTHIPRKKIKFPFRIKIKKQTNNMQILGVIEKAKSLAD